VVAALLAAQLSGIAEAGHGGPDMKAILNAKIKRWESFRPFAPSGRAAATPASVKLYRSWVAKLSVTMSQTPVGSDKLFVDYAGGTVPGIVIG
jgi:hypothetical protein